MKTTTPVRIARPLVNQLLHCAQLSPNQPVCGLVSAHKGQFRCYPMQVDTAPSAPNALLQISPLALRAAQTLMQKAGEEWYAVYHSHPNLPAFPQANEPLDGLPEGILLLVISLNTKGVLEMRGFIRTPQAVEEVELML